MELFVSYARADRATADALVADAESLGHEPFYDQELTGGQRWWDALLDRIEVAAVFVPVLTDAYRASEACRAEAEWAQACGVPFLPVQGAAPQSPALYDPVIAEANWILYDAQSKQSLASLARGLGAVPPVTPPATTPVRPPVPVSYLVGLERAVHDPTAVGRDEQLALVADLRVRLGTKDQAIARSLLADLRARPDVSAEAAAEIDALLGAPPRDVLALLDRRTSLGLAVVATLAWLASVLVLPWAPDRLAAEVSRERHLFGAGSGMSAGFGVLVVLVGLAMTAGVLLAVRRRLPPRLRGACAAAAAVVGIVATLLASNAAGAEAAGTGAWVYLIAMVVLAGTLVFTGPRALTRP